MLVRNFSAGEVQFFPAWGTDEMIPPLTGTDEMIPPAVALRLAAIALQA